MSRRSPSTQKSSATLKGRTCGCRRSTSYWRRTRTFLLVNYFQSWMRLFQSYDSLLYPRDGRAARGDEQGLVPEEERELAAGIWPVGVDGAPAVLEVLATVLQVDDVEAVVAYLPGEESGGL